MNGNTMLTDVETGFIYSPRAVGFTLALKKKFIEIAPKYWPNISLICDFVGISKSAYKAHYMQDKVFRAIMDSLMEKATDRVEAAMANYALEKGNFMDRIAWLRAHRGEKYNEKRIVQVDVNMSKERIDAKQASLSQAIDATIVDTAVVESIAEKTDKV
jgi:hypothetical protein